jgi:hypothetical protein
MKFQQDRGLIRVRKGPLVGSDKLLYCQGSDKITLITVERDDVASRLQPLVTAGLSSSHRNTHVHTLVCPRPLVEVTACQWSKRRPAGRQSGRVRNLIRASLIHASQCQMSALRHVLRNLLQRKSTGQYGEVQGVPFYEAHRPWWAKFTWGLIAADLLVT